MTHPRGSCRTDPPPSLNPPTRKNIKKGIKRCKYNYLNGIFNLSSAFSSIENYMHSYVFIDNKTITNYLNRYW